jgi:hypothetical protein
VSRTLEIPDAVYEALLDAARARGIAPEDWIAEQLSPCQSQASPPTSRTTAKDRQTALDRLLQHTVSLGRPTGADNERIDADLARAYAASQQVLSDQGRI